MTIQESIRDKVEFFFKIGLPNIGNTLGIEFLYISKEMVSAKMPVNHSTIQPFGLLHGGASVVLAETVASVGAWLQLDVEKESAVGVEINANHLRGVELGGEITAEARPVQIGKNIQVWEIEISDRDQKKVCLSRCTLAVVERK